MLPIKGAGQNHANHEIRHGVFAEQPEANGDAKNEIRFAVTPDQKDWEAYQTNGGAWRPARVSTASPTSASPAAPTSAPAEVPPAANPNRPSWAQ